jgi:hypothetical protein
MTSNAGEAAQSFRFWKLCCLLAGRTAEFERQNSDVMKAAMPPRAQLVRLDQR